jgi:hypothetical protein
MLMAPVGRLPRVLTLLVAALLIAAGPAFATAPAAAAPGDPDSTPQALQEALGNALRDYNDAKGRLDASLVRQAKVADDLKATQARLAELQAEVGSVASAAYRGSRMNLAAVVLDSQTPEGLLRAATTVQFMVQRDDRQLHELTDAKRLFEQQQQQLAAEVKLQQDQLAIMDKKKKDAEDALRRAGGGQTTSGVPAPAKATANSAPRNSDGSYPRESCSVPDPTTSGCITPRMLNALNAARAAGFTRYTSCYRSGSFGEHPKGRACDFSATPNGFVDARATGADKAYGDRLAAWCIANASRIGVLYVIWYKQIWQPGIGWKSYSGDGTPAGDHYNHVHLSVQ